MGTEVVNNVMDFGAKGDGTPDDTGAINAALAAGAANGAPVYLPPGTYVCCESVNIPAPTAGWCTILGSGWDTTIVKLAGAGNGIIVPDGTSDWTMRDLQIHVDSGAGPGIFFAPPAGGVGAGGGNDCIENVVIQVENPATSAIQAGRPELRGGVGIEEVFFRRLRVFAASGFTAPLVALYGQGDGALNDITFEECWLEGDPNGQAPMVDIEPAPALGPWDPQKGKFTVQIGYVGDINFEKCIFEVPNAGAVRFRSVRYVRVSACWVGDLNPLPINPIFDIQRALFEGNADLESAVGSPAGSYLFDTLNATAGGLRPITITHPAPWVSAATIYFDGSEGDGYATLLNCKIPWIDNGAHGANDPNPFSNPFINIGSTVNGYTGDPPVGTHEKDSEAWRFRVLAIPTGQQPLMSGSNPPNVFEDVTLGPNGSNFPYQQQSAVSKVRIAAGDGTMTGPSTAFSIGGFMNRNASEFQNPGPSGIVPGGIDGQLLYVYNQSGLQMTLKNESTAGPASLGSQPGNRITTLTGSDVVLRAGRSYAVLQYDGYDQRWILVSTN